MILGMSTATFTLQHVVLGLVGIFAGIIVAIGMLGGKTLPGWTAVFLTTTVTTSVTGFLFHSSSFLPSHAVGIVSLVTLASAMLALYLNVFVGVVQAFQKSPFLQPLAPTQSEPPFLAAQLIVLAACPCARHRWGEAVSPRAKGRRVDLGARRPPQAPRAR
jgi:hypothetical protein